MGYYTRFELHAYDAETYFPLAFADDATHLLDINHFIEERTGMAPYWSTSSEVLFDSEWLKWYDHVDDMKDLSFMFPQYIFCLRGVGEENGDQWAEWYYIGKYYVERMPVWTPKPLDFSKLK